MAFYADRTLILGLVITAILILEDQNRLPRWHWPGFNGLPLIPALYAAIAFHKIGHFVTGKRLGLDAGGISVGPFVFAKSGENRMFTGPSTKQARRWISFSAGTGT